MYNEGPIKISKKSFNKILVQCLKVFGSNFFRTKTINVKFGQLVGKKWLMEEKLYNADVPFYRGEECRPFSGVEIIKLKIS